MTGDRETSQLRAIDIHTHAASSRFVPREFLDGACENMRVAMASCGVEVSTERVRSRMERSMEDELCDRLVEEMDRAQIDVSVLQVPDFTYVWRSALTIAEILQAHREIVARHAGRLLYFPGVDPRWGADGHTLLEHALRDWGAAGFKVYPPCGYAPDDPMLFPFYELCEAYHAPVLTHVGGTSPGLQFWPAEPLRVDEAARRFPRVAFILGHGGISFVQHCLELCRYRPNVYIDISGFYASLQSPGGAASLASILRSGIAHKILFGTDWPLCRLYGDQRLLMERLWGEAGPGAGLPLTDRELVLRGNARRLLGRHLGAVG